MSYGKTHSGSVRDENQDALLLDDQHRLYAVADGLGGLKAGAQASRTAMRHLQYLLQEFALRESPLDLQGFVGHINSHVYAEGREIGGEGGMGTTLTILHLHGGVARIAQVGDSAAFLWRRGELRRVSSVHTMAEEVLAGGHVTRGRLPEVYYHTLTRCIGALPEVEADVVEIPLEVGDRFLLCTDGLTKVFSEAELEMALATARRPQELVNRWFEEALSRETPDNLTAIAVFPGTL